MRVAIIGAGVMGCATALALAKRGAEVVVLERAIPGAEASSAAAGILGAQTEMHEKGKLLAGFVRARAEYAAWAEELRAATGLDIGYRKCGAIHVARTDAEGEHAAIAVAWQKREGLEAELLDAHSARQLEPELAADILAAAHYPEESQVDPPSLLRALLAAIGRARSVTVRAGATVSGLIVERDRCVGAYVDGGELRSDATVLAAGAWSSLVPGIPEELPQVRPCRGQIVQLEERPPRVRSIVLGGEGYVVPRGDGRVLCGSTVELVGYRKEVTAGGVHAILGSALSMVPALKGATLGATWSAFRPYTEGEKMLVGSSPLAGLFLATGHFRNGILLAKATADEVVRAIGA